MENALIIFVRNQQKGKVKTRLAKDIGDDKALEVYKYLLQHTRDISAGCNFSHFIFYSDYVHINDLFDDDIFTKFVQQGNDLGERMMNAFIKVFELGCKKVCIIGSDCLELDTETLQAAFNGLEKNDLVIGPSVDAGYYLLGMKMLHPVLFTGKDWGTSTVLDDTFETIDQLALAYAELSHLNDIDTIEDLLETDILTKIEEDPL